VEVERWRELAEAPLDKKRLRLQLESVEATLEALEQLRLIMGSATKRVKTSGGLWEVPDWPTRLKACRLVLAAALTAVPELPRQPGAGRGAHASHRALKGNPLPLPGADGRKGGEASRPRWAWGSQSAPGRG
jgi:hypothetical protein